MTRREVLQGASVAAATATLSAAAGSPTVYQRTSRQVQLALKVYF